MFDSITELAALCNLGADYLKMTYREIDLYYKTERRERWFLEGNNAFYSNANIKPENPFEFIPAPLRPKDTQKEIATEEEFLSTLRSVKAERK